MGHARADCVSGYDPVLQSNLDDMISVIMHPKEAIIRWTENANTNGFPFWSIPLRLIFFGQGTK